MTEHRILRFILLSLLAFAGLKMILYIVVDTSGLPTIFIRSPVSVNDRDRNRRLGMPKTDGIVPWTSSHPLWCSGRKIRNQSQNLTDGKYFLTAVVMFRIYASDVNKLTIRELVQWLQYLSYAGVEHVYAYDSFLYKVESQRENLRCFVENGYMTYVDWSHKAPLDKEKRDNIAQVPAYQHCLDNFRHEFVWQVVMDIDEYPYCSHDKSPGFLSRAIKEIEKEQKPNVLGRILMENYMFLGKPLNANEHPLLIDRQWRRMNTYYDNSTVKSIFKSKAVVEARVHKAVLRDGYVSHRVDHLKLRNDHYRGMRGFKTSFIMVEDRGMETAVSALDQCLKRCPLGCC